MSYPHYELARRITTEFFSAHWKDLRSYRLVVAVNSADFELTFPCPNDFATETDILEHYTTTSVEADIKAWKWLTTMLAVISRYMNKKELLLFLEFCTEHEKIIFFDYDTANNTHGVYFCEECDYPDSLCQCLYDYCDICGCDESLCECE